MRKLFIVACLFLATPVWAQSLTEAQCNVVKAIDAKFPTLNKGSDDQRREYALKVAQQFAFSFPAEGWGSKDAGGGRPQTKDVVARLRNGVLDGWELVAGATRSVKCNDHITLDGQHFIQVDPHDWLGAGETPPPPPGDFVTKAQLDAAIVELHTTLWGEVDGSLNEIRGRLAKLENGSAGGSSGGDTSDSAKQQLEVSKQIFELLKKTAAKFGVQ